MLVSTLYYATVELKCCVTPQIVTKPAYPTCLHGLLPAPRALLPAPTCNQAEAARSPHHRARERSSESLSEIFIMSPFHMLYLPPCQSDGGKIREVEAILQDTKEK